MSTEADMAATRSTWSSFFRWFDRSKQQRARRQPDFGDHGTAFGLELSMAPQDIAPPVVQVSAPRGRSTEPGLGVSGASMPGRR
jgi:hypothetical protein